MCHTLGLFRVRESKYAGPWPTHPASLSSLMPETQALLSLPHFTTFCITFEFFAFWFRFYFDFFVFSFNFPTTMPWLQTLANGFISLSLIFLPEKGGNNPHLTRLIRSIGGIQVSCPCTHPFKDKNGKPPFRRPGCLYQLPPTASSLTPAFPPQGPSLPESQYLEPGTPWCRAEVGDLAGCSGWSLAPGAVPSLSPWHPAPSSGLGHLLPLLSPRAILQGGPTYCSSEQFFQDIICIPRNPPHLKCTSQWFLVYSELCSHHHNLF